MTDLTVADWSPGCLEFGVGRVEGIERHPQTHVRSGEADPEKRPDSFVDLASIAVLRMALRDDRSELGYPSSFFFAVSALPLVHGLTGSSRSDGVWRVGYPRWGLGLRAVFRVSNALNSTGSLDGNRCYASLPRMVRIRSHD